MTAAVTGPVMLQLYMICDRDFMRDLLGRAAVLGVDTLVLTVDLPVQSARYRDVRSGLAGVQGIDTQLRRFSQIALRPGWAWDVGVRGGPHTLGNFAPVMKEGAGLSQFLAWVGRNFDASITWKDLDWIRQHWDGRLAIKGVLDPDDALAACDAGADSIIVSQPWRPAARRRTFDDRRAAGGGEGSGRTRRDIDGQRHPFGRRCCCARCTWGEGRAARPALAFALAARGEGALRPCSTCCGMRWRWRWR